MTSYQMRAFREAWSAVTGLLVVDPLVQLTNNNNDMDNNSQYDAISAQPVMNQKPEKDVVVDKGLLEGLLDENQN